MSTRTFCRSKANTAGELLVWHVKHAVKVLQEVAHDGLAGKILFDPFAISEPDYVGSGTSNSWATLNQTGLPIAIWKHRRRQQDFWRAHV